ncbi:MAG: hypothetical protein KDC83_02860 [Flavobacteriales bacterium]|nr:hypothetical protein [Flavobacteriales bacterium]
MKKLVIIIISVGMISFMGSCSKCYTCSSPVQIKTASGTTTSTQEDELCTASPKEIEAKEEDGYTCKAS